MQVFVPALWPLNATRCSTPTTNTAVVIDNSPVPLCALTRPAGLTVVTLRQRNTNPGVDPAPTGTVMIDGQRALLAQTTVDGLPGETQLLLTLLEQDVTVVIQAPDEATVRDLLAGVHVLDGVDSLGCATTIPALNAPPQTGRAAKQARLVPTAPVAAVVCRYDNHTLVRSLQLTTQQLTPLTNLLNNLPVGTSPSSYDDQAPGCDKERNSGFVLHLTEPDGQPLTISARIGICAPLSASNGDRTTTVSQPLRSLLSNLVGYDGTIEPLSN